MSADVANARALGSDHPRSDQARLLIIDHQPSFTGFARLVAQKLGYDVSVLADPRNIAASLAAGQPSVLMLEVIMPEFDGIEVINVLAQKGFNGQLILVSGHESHYVDLARKTAEARHLSVTAVLSKPVRQAMMEETLKRVRVASASEPPSAIIRSSSTSQ